jgi:hypothetical protein
MAKINEEIIVIKISTLLSDSADAAAVMDDNNVDALKQVIEQMAGEGARTLVEIERA